MTSGIRCYILVADEEAWKFSIKEKIFGFAEKAKGHWNKSEVGDLLAFYVTRPTKKIIGFGRISQKFKDETLIFPDEKLFKRYLWKNRIKFETIFVIENWNDGIDPPKGIMYNTGRKVISDELYSHLIKSAELQWKKPLLKLF